MTQSTKARSGSPAGNGAAAEYDLSREQKLELYYYMRLTRSLEERLVNLYRQTKVVGGLFRSLAQEADAGGSAYALDRSKGAPPVAAIPDLGSRDAAGGAAAAPPRPPTTKGCSAPAGRGPND